MYMETQGKVEPPRDRLKEFDVCIVNTIRQVM